MARIIVPNIPHHVTQRGNRKQTTFFVEEDYIVYKSLLRDWCGKNGVQILSYCLMPNHVHIIAIPLSNESLHLALGEAHRRYTRRINFRNDWFGHLWQGRFFSVPLSESHLIHAIRYVELNPVRAGIVSDPFCYPWSSAKSHLYHLDDKLLSKESFISGIDNWKNFLQDDIPLDFNDIRSHTKTGRPLGNENFIEKLEKLSGRTDLKKKPAGRKPHPKSEISMVSPI